MLYHYTDRLSAADIVRDSTIRAVPATLHRDILRQDVGYETAPIVWLTTSPDPDGTVLFKMRAAGWPEDMAGNLCRFVLPTDYPCLSLREFVHVTGMDPSLWEWAVRTGFIAGSDYTTWRLCQQSIGAGDWLAVEKLQGTGWEKFD